MLLPSSFGNLLSYLNASCNGDVLEKKTGLEYNGVCPFCGGGKKGRKTFFFNLEKDIGQCYRAACHWYGDSVQFVMDTQNLTWREAKDLLDVRVKTPEMLLNDMNFINGRAASSLSANYESTRSVFDEVADAVPVKYSSKYDEIRDWIENVRGYDWDWFVKTFKMSYSNCQPDRVVFEVESLESKAYLLYAFKLGIQPKTINPPQNVLSSMLFNQKVLEEGYDFVFVVEGLFDAARCMSYGIPAVAVFGTNLSELQQNLLTFSAVKEIVFLFDPDARHKAEYAAERCAEYAFTQRVFIADCPRKDPDECTEDDLLLAYVSKQEVKPKGREIIDASMLPF